MVEIASSLSLFALAAQEEQVGQPGAPTGSESASDSGPSGDPDEPGKGSRGARAKRVAAKIGGRIFGSRSGARKWILAGGIPGVGAVLLIGIALFILAAALKIPNLSANIVEYEFVRVTRQMGNAADDVVQQKLATEMADTTVYQKMVNRAKSFRDGFDDKFFKQLSPKAAIRVLRANNSFDLVYKTPDEMSIKDNLLGRKILKAVKINGETFDLAVEPQRGFSRLFVPKLLSPKYLKFISDRSAFVSDFSPALSAALKTNSVNPFIRFFVADGIRRDLGISLIGWYAPDFTGKTAEKARLEIERQIYRKVNQTPSAESSVPDVKDTANEVREITEKAVEDSTHTSDLEQAILPQNAGIPPGVGPALDKAFSPSILKEVVDFANPIYGVALPMCLIYEGSLDKSGPNVNAALAAETAAFYATSSFADQEKAAVVGNWIENSTAIGAFNDKLGDISLSNPYLRANGVPIDTSTTNKVAEGGSLEPYTLIDATPILGGSVTGKQIKDVANATCPYFTDIRFGIAGGVILTALSIALDIPSGGGATAAEAAAGAGARATISATVKDFLVKFARKFVTGDIEKAITKKALISKAGVLGRQFARDALLIGGLTVAAKILVTVSAGVYNNGLEQGSDFANLADAGGNANAQDICRTYGCRALTCKEQLTTDQEDKAYIVAQNEQRSATDRYLALSNPDSLLNRTASMVYGQFGSTLAKPLINVANIFSGPLGFGTILHSAFGTTFAAEPVSKCADQNYGNVQFGWSAAEEKLMRTESYLPLQNQAILDDSGMEGEILKKYAECFGYRYDDSGSSFDPTATNSKLQLDTSGYDDEGNGGSMGALLSSGKIVRTTTGDIVQDQGLCSPQNLGCNNPIYHDLVCRTRRSLLNTLVTDQLIDMQKVTAE